MTSSVHNIFTNDNSNFRRMKNYDTNRCTNCRRLFDDSRVRMSQFNWFDQALGWEREVGVLEAIVLVFEGLLAMNEKIIPTTEEVSVCVDCLYNVSELYRNYREFMERSVPESYLRNVFEKCMLWPDKNSTINEPVLNINQHEDNVSHHPKFTLVLAESLLHDVAEPEPQIPKLEGELDFADNFEDHFDYCTPSNIYDEELMKKMEPADTLLSIDKFYNNSFSSTSNNEFGIGKQEVKRLPNGKWFIPKIARVRLKRYIDGDSTTVDIGKTDKDLLGKIVKLSDGRVLEMPKPKPPFGSGAFSKTCKTCGEDFQNRKLYFDHTRKHRENRKKGVEVVKFQCDVCLKELSSRVLLKRHVVSVHATDRPYVCETCGKRFPTVDRLKGHVTYYHEYSKEKRREIHHRRYLSKKSRGLLKRPKPGKRWLDSHPDELDKVTCPICQKVFCHPNFVKSHIMAIHNNDRPFVCKFCPKGFICERQRNYHEEEHLGLRIPKVFTCETCGKTGIRSRKDLTDHIARFHCEERPFLCNVCGKSFKLESALKKHHYGCHVITEKNHECDICHIKFKLKSALQTHRKLHTDEKRFLCSECGVKFKARKLWRAHMCSHHGHGAIATCDVCQRGFDKIHQYEKHMAKGIHIKPKYLRPPPARKRNYNAPSYVKANLEKKLARRQNRLKKMGPEEILGGVSCEEGESVVVQLLAEEDGFLSHLQQESEISGDTEIVHQIESHNLFPTIRPEDVHVTFEPSTTIIHDQPAHYVHIHLQTEEDLQGYTYYTTS